MPLRSFVPPAAAKAVSNPYPPGVGRETVVAAAAAAPPSEDENQPPRFSVEAVYDWRDATAAAAAAAASYEQQQQQQQQRHQESRHSSNYYSDYSDADDDNDDSSGADDELNNFDLLRLIGGDDFRSVLGGKRSRSLSSRRSSGGLHMVAAGETAASLFAPFPVHGVCGPECQERECCWGPQPPQPPTDYYDGGAMGRFLRSAR